MPSNKDHKIRIEGSWRVLQHVEVWDSKFRSAIFLILQDGRIPRHLRSYDCYDQDLVRYLQGTGNMQAEAYMITNSVLRYIGQKSRVNPLHLPLHPKEPLPQPNSLFSLALPRALAWTLSLSLFPLAFHSNFQSRAFLIRFVVAYTSKPYPDHLSGLHTTLIRLVPEWIPKAPSS